MRNTIGNNLSLTLFGESHGKAIGACLDGLPGGIKVDEDFIKHNLSLRRPLKNETKRVEADEFEIISGVFNGYTTGAPLTIIIPNKDVKSADYEATLARPSHADYVANEKYHGYQDYRGGGHFSGRVSAAIVAVCSILIQTLENKNILIGSHILRCGDVNDASFKDVENDIKNLNHKDYPTILDIKDKIDAEIEKASNELDSIGGILEVAIANLPVGIGEPWFSSLEGELAKAMFAIGGIKGIEFGAGFDFANLKGSTANDAFINQDGKIVTTSNNNGGINGGISNGMPVIFKLAVKPTPSISKPQQSINLKTKQNEEILIKGRHDPAIIRRMNIVVKSLTAFVMADLLSVAYGADYLKD